MRNLLARCSVGLAVFVLGLASPSPARADIIVVEVHSDFFSPREVSVSAGDTVFWVFLEGVHTTTSSDMLWDSGIQLPGVMFENTFNDLGDFNYTCTIHFQCCDMEGTVHVVQPLELVGNLTASDIDPNAIGTANYEQRPNRSSLDVLVGGIDSTTAVDVFVNGNFVGTIALDDSGSGELSLNTESGDTVPQLQNGDEIEIYDAVDDTTLVLIGNVQAP